MRAKQVVEQWVTLFNAGDAAGLAGDAGAGRGAGGDPRDVRA